MSSGALDVNSATAGDDPSGSSLATTGSGTVRTSGRARKPTAKAAAAANTKPRADCAAARAAEKTPERLDEALIDDTSATECACEKSDDTLAANSAEEESSDEEDDETSGFNAEMAKKLRNRNGGKIGWRTVREIYGLRRRRER